jgi:SpoVK/Ycf46/Vps4 family AAA+-type ATPase
MSFVKKGGGLTIDTDELWERKRKAIETIPGLSVWREPAKFDQIGGLDNLKAFLSDILKGNASPRIIVFIDEIEKAMAGATTGEGDSSGTSQEMLGTMLTEMNDQNYTGVILIGPPGTCKSQIAKATGGEAGIPVIRFDLSAMKSKYVGTSNEQLAAALAVIRSVSQGQAYFIATCNEIAKLPAALKRRFSDATYYIDLPTEEERARIWPIYLKKFGLDETQPLPSCDGWTGADIKSCCSLAWRLNRPVLRAAQSITPVARTDEEGIARLRQQADGKFLSASYEGFYHRLQSASSAPPSTKLRTIQVGEGD